MSPGSGKTPIFTGQASHSPVGVLWVAASDQGLVAIEDGLSRAEFAAYLQRRFQREAAYAPERTREAIQQIIDYLGGMRTAFQLPIDWSTLTPFQQAALQATCEIPRGQTRTYQQIAERIGHPHAARAVGRVEATNPLPLVIPCHRVVGTDGGLHGYGFGKGLEMKEWLLKLEGVQGP